MVAIMVDKLEPHRPHEFTPEIGQLICKLIDEGISVSNICASVEGMPHRATVFRWLSEGADEKTEDLKAFTIEYARSMDRRVEIMADELINLADHKTNDFIYDANGNHVFDDNGNPMIDHNNVQRAKLQIETRLKYMALLKPKKYGTINTTKLIGDKDNPINVQSIQIELTKPMLNITDNSND